MQKIVVIRDCIDNSSVTTSAELYMEKVIPEIWLTRFSELSSQDVCKIIHDFSNPTCMTDPLPTRLIKKCLKYLLPVITRVINLSFQSGIFHKG